MSIDAFSLYFGQLEDPRQSAKVSYLLFDILFLTVLPLFQVPMAGKILKVLPKIIRVGF